MQQPIQHFCAWRGEDDSKRIFFQRAQKICPKNVGRVIDQLLDETRQTFTCKYVEVNFEALELPWMISHAIDCMLNEKNEIRFKHGRDDTLKRIIITVRDIRYAYIYLLHFVAIYVNDITINLKPAIIEFFYIIKREDGII